ncbi:MAG TPA: carbohydrate ABC transporter permease [Spirochaetes bacterium]|nr:carbohydrate ABC transporter permease [Spirochaetota bacterium]
MLKTGSIRNRKIAADIATYILLSIFSLIILLPILWIVRLSFTTKFVAYKIPPEWFFKPILDNYRSLFVDYGFGQFFYNSLVVAIGSTAIAIPIAFFAAYSFNRFNTGGRSLQFGILGLQMLPPIVLSLPIFVLMKTFNLLNTRGGLIASYLSFNLPFVIWMLMGFIESIPVELEEAAKIDGATRFQAVIRIVFPLATPGIMASGVLSFILCWNEFLFALILTAKKTSTVPIALAAMQTERGVMLGTLAAAMCFAIIPMLALSIAIQKYMVRGLTFGALK